MQYLSDYRRKRRLLLEPGGFDRFPTSVQKVCLLLSPNSITHLFFSHQDPDICASFPSWTKWNEDIKLVVSSLWTRFMLHYESRDLSGRPTSQFSSKYRTRAFRSVERRRPTRLYLRALSSPRNILVHDTVSGFLFSGDVGAAMYKDPHSGS